MRTPSLRSPVAFSLLLLAASPALAEEPFADLEIPSALARAEKSERLVVLFFHDADAANSNRMLAKVYGDENVQKWLGKHAVPLLIPLSHTNARSRFDITQFPSTVFLRPDARILHRMVGYRDVDDFLLEAEVSLFGLSEPEEPSGDDANNPVAWLAWSNFLFSEGGERAEECQKAYYRCLDHGDETMPGFRARHLDFLLERLSYLKAHSQDALDGLFARRADLAARMTAGIGTPAEAYDYTRFNSWLRDEYITVDFFVQLGEFDTDAHDTCRRVLLEAELKRIVDHRKYDEVLAVIPDPLVHVKGLLKAYTANLEAGRSDVGVRAKIINDSASLFECLLHAGRGADATELFEEVTGSIVTGRAFFAFIERTSRLELHALSRKIATAGLESVKQERGLKMLENAMSRIPDTDAVGEGTTAIPKKGGRDVTTTPKRGGGKKRIVTPPKKGGQGGER